MRGPDATGTSAGFRTRQSEGRRRTLGGRHVRPRHRQAGGGPVDVHAQAQERSMQFGRSYEEFEVGATYKHWPGKTVTEYDDHLFCLLTMNHHPLHLDEHYAGGTTQFGQERRRRQLRLLAAARHVGARRLRQGDRQPRDRVPAPRGADLPRDTLYGETRVLDKWESTSKDDRGVVHVETIGYNQDGKVVCIFRRKVMVPKQTYLHAAAGAAGRPVPQPDKNWPGPGDA